MADIFIEESALKPILSPYFSFFVVYSDFMVSLVFVP